LNDVDIPPLADSECSLVRRVIALEAVPEGARARVLARIAAIIGSPSAGGDRGYPAAPAARPNHDKRRPSERLTAARPHFLVVDDEPFARRLEKTLRRWGDSTIVRNVEDAARAVRARVYSAAFIDVRLDPGCGLDVLADFRGVHPRTPVMVLTGFFEGRDSVRACELRAQYVEKPISLAAVQAFVEAALQDPFSDREREVVRRLLLGQETKTIASDCGIAESTIRTLIQRAKAKVGARTRSGMLEKATYFGVSQASGAARRRG
jgi:DNA-binding NarL/FixJ family response regulator